MKRTIDSNQTVWLTSKQFAERIGISSESLDIWRCQGKGPTYVKLGPGKKSAVRYRLSDVIAWENSLTRVVHSNPQMVEAGA